MYTFLCKINKYNLIKYLELSTREGPVDELDDELHVGLGRPLTPHDQRVAIAMAILDVLWTAQAVELAVDHDGQTGTHRLTLLHTEFVDKRSNK